MSAPNRQSEASLTDQLFQDLFEQVRSGKLTPGQRLPTQKEIAATANVSRTVVREAVARLAAQGLVVSRQGSGVYVAESANYQAFQVTAEELADLNDVLKLLEIRMAVESEMASLAAERRTDQDLAEMRACLDRLEASASPEQAAAEDAGFHLAMARATKNQYFERFVEFLGVRLVPPRYLVWRGDPNPHEGEPAARLRAEHESILRAITDKDPDAARSAARDHMLESLLRHSLVNRQLSGRKSGGSEWIEKAERLRSH